MKTIATLSSNFTHKSHLVLAIATCRLETLHLTSEVPMLYNFAERIIILQIATEKSQSSSHQHYLKKNFGSKYSQYQEN